MTCRAEHGYPAFSDVYRQRKRAHHCDPPRLLPCPYGVVVISDAKPPNRLKWVLAQLGPKAGAGRSKAMLLRPADLGPNWRKVDERTWRTGTGDSEAARRAREAGSITAWRSFATIDGTGWLWCQVMPHASAADATNTLSRVDEMFLRNLRATVDIVSEREVDPPEIVGADQAWGYEQETVHASGSALAMYLGIRVASVVAVMSASESAASWSLLADLGGIQIQRIQSADDNEG